MGLLLPFTRFPVARIAGVDIPRDKRVEIALTYVYGIGLTRAQKILAKSGMPIIRAGTLMEAAERAVSAWQNDVAENTRVRAVS